MLLFNILSITAESSIFYGFINRIFAGADRRENSLFKYLAFVIFAGITLSLNMTSIDKTIKLFIITMTAVLITLFLYNVNFIQAAANNLVWVIIVILCNSLTGGIIMSLTNMNIAAIMEDDKLRIIYVMLNIMMEVIFLFFYSSIIMRNNTMLKYGKWEFTIIGIWTLSCLVTLVCAMEVVFTQNVLNNALSLMMFFVSASSIIFYIIIFLVFEKYVEKQNLKKEEEKAESFTQIIGQYYHDLEQENRKIKELCHDMKNHLAVYDELNINDSELGMRYKEKILNKINSFENYYDTGNVVLDILLKKKTEQAKDIRMDVVIQKGCLKGFDMVDMCAIFSNAIDNAIEHQIGREGYNWIRIRSTAANEKNVFILFENHLYEPPVIKNGRMMSQKAGKSHGIGNMSIRSIVEKYDGMMRIICEDDIFSLIICL